MNESSFVNYIFKEKLKTSALYMKCTCIGLQKWIQSWKFELFKSAWILWFELLETNNRRLFSSFVFLLSQVNFVPTIYEYTLKKILTLEKKCQPIIKKFMVEIFSTQSNQIKILIKYN